MSLNKNFIRVKSNLRKKFPTFYKFLYLIWWQLIKPKIWLFFNRPKGTLVYVGLNKGESFSNIYYKYEIALGYEPNPLLFEKLQVKFKKKKNVKIFNYAASDRNSIANFYLSNNKDMVSSSLSKFSKSLKKKIGYKKTIKVKTVNLGEHLYSLNIDFIDEYLSDAQGYDLKILKSLENYIMNNKILKITCEVNRNNKLNPYYESDNYEDSFYKYLPSQYKKAASGQGNLIVGRFEYIPSSSNHFDITWINTALS